MSWAEDNDVDVPDHILLVEDRIHEAGSMEIMQLAEYLIDNIHLVRQSYQKMTTDICTRVVNNVNITDKQYNALKNAYIYMELEDEEDDPLEFHNPLEEKVLEVLKYCEGNTQYTWAAMIVAKLLDCDFRDSEQRLKQYLNRRKNG
jgi:hypothetical protein